MIKLSDKEQDALWFWQEGLKGWGFKVIRDVCNGNPIPKWANIRSDQEAEVYEICRNFEHAIEKLPIFRGDELVRVTGDYAKYHIKSRIKFEKYTSFSANNSYNNSIYRNIGMEGNGTNLFIVDVAKSSSKFRQFYGVLKTITDSEKEVLNAEPVTGVIMDIRDINIGGDPLPDWLGGGYSDGYNFKAHYIKIV